jgi:hypothetical protein
MARLLLDLARRLQAFEVAYATGPPRDIVGELRKCSIELPPRLPIGLSSADSVCEMGPTASLLDITTNHTEANWHFTTPNARIKGTFTLQAE